MNGIAEEIERYKRTWSRLLTNIRGCTDEDASRWAAPFLGDHPELTLHEPATRWVAGALVPVELRGTLDAEMLAKLSEDIQFALDRGDDFWEPVSKEDLTQAGRRVQLVLENYRTTLAAGIASDVIPTELSRAEALDRAVRVVSRQWGGPGITYTVNQNTVSQYKMISFGRARRITMQRPGQTAGFWYDPFGLNIVVRDAGCLQSARVVDAVRTAFHLAPDYRAVA